MKQEKRETGKKLIGFYDYTVVLTYIGLSCSVIGMTQAINARFRIAIVCLALSGLCDMFDGKIARSKKNRTPDEKMFGMQIDSLCDVICFGVYPAMICWLLGVRGIVGWILLCFYCVCSVIRLGYFNVLETKRQQEEEGANKYYHGLPITSMAIVLPLVFMLQVFISNEVFICALYISLFVVGLLFIVDFRLKKPGNSTLVILVAIVAVAVIIMVLFSNFHIPKLSFPNTGFFDWLSETITKQQR